MASFNKVILLGNLTRDPELRVTAEGQSICKLGLATNRSFKDKEGNLRDETTYVDIDAFGRQAETIAQYLNRGNPILIEGRLRYDQWEGPGGEKRNKLKVTLESFTFVGSRADQDNHNSSSYEQKSPPPRSQANLAPHQTPKPAPPNLSKSAEKEEDDVPF